MTAPAQASADSARQSSWLIGFHWLTMLMIICGVAAVLSRGLIDDKATRASLLGLHRALGLAVMILSMLRLALSFRIKVKVVELGRLQVLAANASHFLLYALLISIPLVGWALTSAHGQDVSLFGVVPLPSLTARDRDLADQLQELHEALAIVLLCVVLLHSSAALWHHYVRRDAVLTSMLPGLRRR